MSIAKDEGRVILLRQGRIPECLWSGGKRPRQANNFTRYKTPALRSIKDERIIAAKAGEGSRNAITTSHCVSGSIDPPAGGKSLPRAATLY